MDKNVPVKKENSCQSARSHGRTVSRGYTSGPTAELCTQGGVPGLFPKVGTLEMVKRVRAVGAQPRGASRLRGPG